MSAGRKVVVGFGPDLDAAANGPHFVWGGVSLWRSLTRSADTRRAASRRAPPTVRKVRSKPTTPGPQCDCRVVRSGRYLARSTVVSWTSLSTTRCSTGRSSARRASSSWRTSTRGGLPCRPVPRDQRPQRQRCQVRHRGDPAGEHRHRDHHHLEHGEPAVDPTHERRITLNRRPQRSSDVHRTRSALAESATVR